MKKSRISELVNTFALPVLLIAMGLVLLFNPDSATILITRVIAWILTVAGVVYGLLAISSPAGRVSRCITAAAFLAIGGFLLINPLFLAKNISRFLGVLLAIEGGQGLSGARGSKLMGIITMVIAAVLIFLPMAASRLVFILCSLVLLAVGIAQLADRLKTRKKLTAGEDPNIIDAL